jgi:thioredoxin 2
MNERHAYRCVSCGQWNRVPAARADDGASCGRCRTRLDTSGAPLDADVATVDAAVAGAPVPVIVDLWAPWCGPCRVLGPSLATVAKEQRGQVLVLKVNTDEHRELSERHEVRGIPTLLVFAGGRLIDRQVGALPLPQLRSWVSGQPGPRTHA